MQPNMDALPDTHRPEGHAGDYAAFVDIVDEVDGSLVSLGHYCNKFIKKYGSQKRKKACKELTISTVPDDNKDVYNFNHVKRGLAVIINNVRYPTPDGGIQKRKGSNRDAARLEKLFRHLGFEVKRYNDLTKNEMLSKLQEAASNTIYNHSEADCFACAILAHGCQEMTRTENTRQERQDVLFGVDWEFVPTKYLLGLFNDDCCPELQNKPRLFFIQACRGYACDKGTDVTVCALKTKKKKLFKRKGRYDKDAVSSDSASESSSDTELESEQGEEGQSAEESIQYEESMLKEKGTVDGKLRKKVMDEGEEGNETRSRMEYKPKEIVSEPAAMKGQNLEEIEEKEKAEVEKESLITQDEVNKRTGNKTTNPETAKDSADYEIPVSPAPLYQDFLLMYASPPGYFAWRNSVDGGWLIQGLKSILMEQDVSKVSFLKLLTRVSGKVARECKASHKDLELNESKLVPCIMSMLTKDIYFGNKHKYM